MKLGCIFIGLSLLFVGFQPARRPDFSGTWQLDLKKSSNLPESFKHVESYAMEVRLTKDSMILMVRLTGNGQDVKFPLTSYALNGSEGFREDTLRLSKRCSKVSQKTTGTKLIIESRVEQGRDTLAQKYTQHDVWEFTEHDMLQISITQKFPSGKEPHSERRIFHRVK